MKCEKCGVEEAVYRVTRIERDGRVVSVALGGCPECRAEMQRRLVPGAASTIEELIQALLDSAPQFSGASDDRLAASVTCSNCGLDFTSYKRSLMLGCPHCYRDFAEWLTEDLEAFHGATEHVTGEGALAAEQADLRCRVEALRADLSAAIESEEYSRAASLRDEIKVLETRLAEISVEGYDREQRTAQD